MVLKGNLKVFIGTVNLADDGHNIYYRDLLNHINRQETTVELMEPFLTQPYSGKWMKGTKEYLYAITDRLNNIVDEFMKTDATHLWILDGDVQPPPHALDTLIKHNVDIASGIYTFHGNPKAVMFGRIPDTEQYNFIPRALDWFKGQIIGEDMMVGGGNGCMLIKRRVFKRYHPRIHPMRFESPQGKGSDIYFWWKCQKAGFTARVDGNVLCGHMPEAPLKSFEE